MTEPLDRIGEIFECAEVAEFDYKPVRDADVAAFSKHYRQFKRRLGEAREDQYWRRFLRPLGYYRFEALAAPLSFNSSVLETVRRSETLQEALRRVSQLYPQQTEEAEALVTRFDELSARSDAPLLSSIQASVEERETPNSVLVISEPRLVAGVSEELNSRSVTDGLTVVSPRQLMDHDPFPDMYLVGRLAWFPEWLVRAPRARQVTLVSYAGIRAAESPGPLLDENQQGRPLTPVQFDVGSNDSESETGPRDSEDLDDLSIRPELNLDAIEDRMRRAAESSDDAGARHEIVTARPIELEGDNVVFFEDDDETTTWVIDLEEEGEDRVRSLPVEAVETGMFILLRTEGGGDVLIPIADMLLGDEAERLRSMQESWKSALRDYLLDAGLRKTVSDLRAAGCSVASRINVKRWISPSRHVIKTKKRHHFEAILDTVGLEHSAEDYWKAMVAIRDMHLRAGQVIRERLFAAVARADLGDLAGRGIVRFELAEADAGQLSAYRVRSVLDRSIQLPRDRLREVVRGSIV